MIHASHETGSRNSNLFPNGPPNGSPILVLPAEFSCSLTLPDDARRRSTVSEYDSLANVYDLEYAHDYDLPFWLSLAEREAGPVVEWGAGTGRLAVSLAAAGHDVTAVEVSAKMAERGRKKGPSVDWTVGDMRDERLERSYGLAICAFNSFLCLRSMEEALAFLRNAHEHLVPGGLLGIEVSVFSPEELAGGPELRHDFTRELPNGRLDRFSVSTYDAATQLMHMRLFYERYDGSGSFENRMAQDLTIRITNRDELLLMLRLSGFEAEQTHGDFEGEPFSSASDNLLMLARKQISDD
jgi:SAM-dependent methyltransferase